MWLCLDGARQLQSTKPSVSCIMRRHDPPYAVALMLSTKAISTMRGALFSDLHGNIVRLQAVLARIEQLGGADAIFALGDFLAVGPGGDDLLDQLEIAHGKRLFVCHAAPGDPWSRACDADAATAVPSPCWIIPMAAETFSNFRCPTMPSC